MGRCRKQGIERISVRQCVMESNFRKTIFNFLEINVKNVRYE
jgi:hypothetical protein